MTDYVKTTDFTAKDALTTGDPNKIITGVDFDTEFDNLATAIATKLESDDIASQAQAEAGSSNSVLMTPGRVTQWAQYNAGVVEDLQELTDPGADRIPFWDESANAVVWGTPASGLGISSTTISVDHDAATNFVANEHIDHTGVTLTAGDGLDGGGDISASRNFAVDATVLRTTGAFAVSGDWTITGDWDFDGVSPTIDAVPIATTADIAASGVFVGYVGANGVTGNNIPAGWSVVRNGAGDYTVTHSLGLSLTLDLAVALTPVSNSSIAGRVEAGAGGVDDFRAVFYTTSSGAASDSAFFFIAKEIV